GPDVVVSELQRLAERQLENLLGPRRERDVSRGSRLALSDDLFDLRADRFQRDAQGLQGLRGHALALVDEPEQDVLGPDVVVVDHPRLFLGEDHDAPGAVGEPFKHLAPSGPNIRPVPRSLPPPRINGPRPTLGAKQAPLALSRRERPRAGLYPGGP